MTDAVEHPDHYKWHPAVECIEVAQEFNFNLGNVIKYVWRAGRKVVKGTDERESRIEDLRKARRYIDFEIARLTESMPEFEVVPERIVEAGRLRAVPNSGWVNPMNRCWQDPSPEAPGHVGAKPHTAHTYGVDSGGWCDGYV